MRKIRTPEEVEKSEKRKRLIVGVILIGLMAFSSLGYAFFGLGSSSESDESLSNPYFDGNQWILDTGGIKFYLVNSVESVKDIPVDIENNLQDYLGAPLFIASDNDLSTNEVAANLGQYSSRMQRACYGACEEDLPEKDCTENLIVFRESEQKSVLQEDKCVFINGDIESVDAFLYSLAGNY
ncbi:hypothetical protein COU60_00380 [Candidatus Pacearchaeota archaeon CG10_big_fil_rev_8_21_14_0_10_34_76]|nr:MAG: hypothetical protein COU60_00380 [Candidatus Pacearchaeota archaeon CG10_big_fil_rev_8_21_14_0_10_34_76]